MTAIGIIFAVPVVFAGIYTVGNLLADTAHALGQARRDRTRRRATLRIPRSP